METTQELKEKRSKILDETVDYYSADPEGRRCVQSVDGGCYYSGETAGKPESEGCAVGRLLSPELRKYLDTNSNKYFNPGVSGVWLDLPDEIKDLGLEFLKSLQLLHDRPKFWTSNGLTEQGRNQVEFIKTNFTC